VPTIAAASWNKSIDWSENKGYRAEVRREGKSEITSAL